MKTYARVDGGIVQEIIEPMADLEGNEHRIEDRFAPEFVAQMVDVTDVKPMPEQMWNYADGLFSAPAPYAPSPQETLSFNTSIRDLLLASATLAIAPLQDAVDLDEATPAEVALLKKWKQYRVAVNRVDLTVLNPEWPIAPA